MLDAAATSGLKPEGNTVHAAAPKKVAIAGNPNCGKTTLFNLLTGLNQHTGNFPGVTVEKVTGRIISKDKQETEVTDLPGIYGLQPNSLDEKVAVEVLTNPSSPDHPHLVMVVVDTINLRRGLFLASLMMDKGLPLIIVLNEMGEGEGLQVNATMLSQLLGVKVLTCNARSKKGIEELKAALLLPVRPVVRPFIAPRAETMDEDGDTQLRFQKLKGIIEKCSTPAVSDKRKTHTDNLDRLFTHKIWGFAIFLLVLLGIFEAVFFLAQYPMQWIEAAFTSASSALASRLPDSAISRLLTDGLLAGLGGIVVFVPQIAFLFFFIAILEETGYMARVSFIMDKLMRKCGLNGRSVIPLISGVACAVPAIMSARTISNWKERLITILVTPFMSCSARLPVYILLVSLISPSATGGGSNVNNQALVLMALYLLGFATAIGSAFVLSRLIRSHEKSFFIMEMPLYRSPHWSSVAQTVLNKAKVFVFDAGKVILAVSVILWALSSYGPGDSLEQIEQRYAVLAQEFPAEKLEANMAAEKLEASYVGIIGKTIEPLLRPLGYDWKIGIAIITSFAAREVFVATMSTIYSVGSSDSLPVRQKMLAETDPRTGLPVYSFATIVSLLVFYAFSMQCASTLAVVFRETGKLKWPLFQFFYMGALAYAGSMLVYNLFK